MFGGFDPFSAIVGAAASHLSGGGGRPKQPRYGGADMIGGFDVGGTLNRKNVFAPARTLEQLYDLPEMQAYLNQQQSVFGQALQGIYGGTANAQRQGMNQAASQGLGRGFGTQLGTNLQMQGAGQASSAAAAARLGDIYRQASASQSIADAIMQAQRAKFLKRQQPSTSDQLRQAGIGALQSFPQGLGMLLGGIL